jgi:hypothetical protein
MMPLLRGILTQIPRGVALRGRCNSSRRGVVTLSKNKPFVPATCLD